MPYEIRWSRTTRANFSQILDFYLTHTGEEVTARLVTAIYKKLDFIAAQPYASSKSPQLPENYRVAYVLKYKYTIYYKVMRQNAVKLAIIQHSRRKPPTPEKIIKASKT